MVINMLEKTVLGIAARMIDIGGCRAEQIQWEEGGGAYRVWRIRGDGRSYILKNSSERELEVYRAISGKSPHVPLILGETLWRRKPWILMEDIQGKNLSHPTRRELTAAIDAVIELQRPLWGSAAALGESVEESLPLRRLRRRYLPGIGLRLAFDRAMREYVSVPVTLGHDDLLPQNVIVCDGRAVLIDWEYGGMLPYPVMLARLIAHGFENDVTPFHLSTEDKSFALDRYYDGLAHGKGITREEYDYTMDCFIFYEMTEWVYVYRKCLKRPDRLYEHYLAEARAMSKRILKAKPPFAGEKHKRYSGRK